MKVSIIGCGGLGSALAIGLLRSSIKDISISLCDRNEHKVKKLARMDKRIIFAPSPAEVSQHADVLVIAVKPKDVLSLIEKIAPYLKKNALVVSCASGISTRSMHDVCKENVKVARAMPNTASSLGHGTTGLFLSSSCDQNDREKIAKIFEALGEVRFVSSEDKLHAVTSVSGSGPAFILRVLEAMAQAGEENGLSSDEALFFAKGALSGAAALASQHGVSISDLIKQITSPNGTTFAGLKKLEKENLASVFSEAIYAATERSKEMARDLG